MFVYDMVEVVVASEYEEEYEKKRKKRKRGCRIDCDRI